MAKTELQNKKPMAKDKKTNGKQRRLDATGSWMQLTFS